MTGPAIVLIVLLALAFLAVLALILWQGSKGRPDYEPLEYVVEDAVKHVAAGLAAEGRSGLEKADIRRILEWEVFYLQGLAQKRRRQPVETVAGGHERSVEYIVERISSKHGVSYSREDVEDVLRYEADYLMRIGAVGERVDGGEEE